MEIPKAISLWSCEGDHAGFMLLAPDAGNVSGNCVFMLTPASCAGIESEMGIVVSELKETGEHCFRLASADTGRALTVFTDGFPDVLFHIDEKFSGDVFTEMDGVVKCVGSAGTIRANA